MRPLAEKFTAWTVIRTASDNYPDSAPQGPPDPLRDHLYKELVHLENEIVEKAPKSSADAAAKLRLLHDLTEDHSFNDLMGACVGQVAAFLEEQTDH